MYNSFPRTKSIVTKRNGNQFELNLVEGKKGQMLFIEYSKVKPNNIETNDIIELFYKDGTSKKYEVIEPGFYDTVSLMPAHYQIKIKPYEEKKEYKTSQKVLHNLHNNGNIIIANNATNCNIAINQDVSVFDEIAKKIKDNNEIENKEILCRLLDEMKNLTNDKSSFSKKYNEFVQNLANHITIITPFLPILASFL